MLLLKFRIPVIAIAFFVAIVIIGCGVGNDDFTDTPIGEIKKIIDSDTEGLFAPGLNNDGDSLYAADLTKSLAKNGASDFWMNAANGIRFGRFIQSVERIDPIDIIIQDTLAYATVRYRLNGSFIIDSVGARSFKPLRHQLSRSITFVQRNNPATNEEWQPLTISAAYGSSLDPATLTENTRVTIDSIWIMTPDQIIFVDDPAEIVNFYHHPITLQNNDSIVVLVKVRNRIDGFDRPVGFITNGKNKDTQSNQYRRRLEMIRIPFTDYYRKTVYIEFSQKRGYNQLVIDFLTLSTITKRSKPYDSYMIAVPYRVQ
ncbi:hypothetical protein JNL27_09340 [bacterium]|nr:hypothetical protein [bacterium]